MQKPVHQPVGFRVFLTTAIATISFGLPTVAQSQPTLIAQAPSRCRLVKQDSNIYSQRNPDPKFAIGRIDRGTEVELVKTPDPASNFAQINLNPPQFIESRNLQLCSTPLPTPTPTPRPTPKPANNCRMVNNQLGAPLDVMREPRSNSIVLTQVNPKQRVSVTRFPDGRTVIIEGEGRRWVQLDLQQSFGRNFGLKPAVGWMYNSDIGSTFSNLVNCP